MSIYLSSYANNNGLFFSLNLVFIFQKFSHISGGINTIHHWHIEISKNNLIAQAILVCVSKLVICLLASDAEVYLSLNAEAQALQDHSHGREAELLIVDNENAILLEDMELVFQGAWEGLERPNVV